MYADGNAHTFVNTRKNSNILRTRYSANKVLSSQFLPSLAVHSPSPHLLVGSLDVVVTEPSIRGLGKVGTLATGFGGGTADGEILGDAERH